MEIKSAEVSPSTMNKITKTESVIAEMRITARKTRRNQQARA